MRKLILGAVLALALPVATAGAAGHSPNALAKSACKTEKAQMGTKLFKKTYAAKSAAKATAKCVAKTVPAAETEFKNAAKECDALRDADPAKFATDWGTNKNGRNAYGKCVSSKAKAHSEERTEARVNAAKSCRDAKAADKAAFDTAYGTKRNAFGKCVSKTAAAQQDQESQQS